jgi:alpha-tubulin suppressor-like RCC1 family protein
MRNAVVLAFVGLTVAVAAEAGPRAKAERAPLTTRESFVQRLVFRSHGASAGLAVRETRRLRAALRVPVAKEIHDAATGETLVGLRVGDFSFQRALVEAPDWAPGRTHATFVVRSADPQHHGAARVAVSWSGGWVKMQVRSTADAPVASDHAGDAAGALAAPFDAAARFGSERFRLAGQAEGRVGRQVVDVLGEPVALARVGLTGRAEIASDDDDGSAPVVAISAPEEEAAVPAGPLQVTGTVADDRTISRVTYAVGVGPETDVAFAVDPSSGFLDDLRATFSFQLVPPKGRVTVRVRAYDAAANQGVAAVDFVVETDGGVQVAAARDHVLVKDALGRVQEWGFLGGTTVDEPRLVPGLEGVRAVAAGTDGFDGTFSYATDFSVALMADGTLRAWGVNAYGELGDGSATPSATPLTVPGIDHVAQVAACGPFVLALRTDGSVWVWGDGAVLGDGTTASRPTPASVPGLPKIQRIAAGLESAYAVDEQGRLWVWGANWTGQLGYDTASSLVTRPVRLDTVSGIVEVAASGHHVVAVASDGTAWSWGNNATFGGVAQNSTANTVAPAKMLLADGGMVAGLGTSAAVGYSHSLLLAADGTLAGCTARYGFNYGQLGDGTTDFHQYVVPVPGLTGVVGVSAGLYASYAVLDDGRVFAWGQNTHGVLGDGGSDDQHEPVEITLQQ